MGSSNQFYTNLPVNGGTFGALLRQPQLFAEVPADWYVVITDIERSTNAVFEGKHEQVNLIATGSIVSVLNIAFARGITVPFFFGGDGATFLVPPDVIDPVMKALYQYRVNTKNNFGLELRTGKVPVSAIYAEAHQLHLAKFSSNPSFSIPVLLGDGLAYAERLIKGPDYLFAEEAAADATLDLTGMQCRWDRIAPPEDQEEIVTLLVVVGESRSQAVTFQRVMDKMDKLYGAPEKRQPISVAQLQLKTTFHDLGMEMRARLGKINWLELIWTWILNLYGFIYFRTTSGKNYLNSLVEMSDTLVIDGRINTVISGSKDQRMALMAALDKMEQEGDLFYGVHISNASIMSCYVRDLKDGHVHFVDGSEGGYTKAAGMLKAKIRSLGHQ
ncbi:hypothetical protein PBAL39_22275 [Pedobacter sp. BAL39]|uniref:DUF3095 domain-containing protein n=1 Tax=Pedobacter sp. BAL39 TaxID=391596 RepID=UPI00015594A7|nr:DUF3095 domain-containing protein [Pedobacter sp. BAL39]EDM38846.1 hypothetical protein PBAL39_22275 [Pedobacter sp. BAL39]